MKNQAFPPKSPLESGKTHQSGSILIMILIAVALFGTLSFVIMNSSRVNQGMVGSEQAKLAAAEIMDYGRIMRETVKTMMVGGLTLREIDFRSTTLLLNNGSSYNMYNNYCSKTSCQVFSPSGGKLSATQFYNYGTMQAGGQPTWVQDGGVEPGLVKIEGIGTSLSDLVFRVPAVQSEICKAFNKLNGIETWPIAEDYSGETYYPFTADVDVALAKTDNFYFGQDRPELKNKTAFCVGSPISDIYIVIQAR